MGANEICRQVPERHAAGESAEQDAAGAAVSIRIGERVIRNPCDGHIDRVAELATEASLVAVVPILDSLHVELGSSPDEDRNGQ